MTNPMLMQLSAMREALHQLTVDAESLFADAADIVRGKGDWENGELVDFLWHLKQMESYCDELRKEALARRNILERVVAARSVKASLNDGDLAVRGERGTATPSVRYQPIIPKREDPEYRSLLLAMGVSEEAIDKGLLQLHWKHVEEWLTRIMADGREAPIPIETRAVWSCRLSTRKNQTTAKEDKCQT